MMEDDKKKPIQPHGRVFVTPERCKGCGYCIEFCPTKVLAFSDDFNSKGFHPPYAARPEVCTGCNLCGIYCPDVAIFGIRVSITDDKESRQ
jgi:2-oxoglutarate ferredoxin oxidoreductase subunit delta